MNQETIKKAGRPIKPQEQKQNVPVRVMLTNNQADKLKVLADEKGVSVSQYIRLVLEIK